MTDSPTAVQESGLHDIGPRVIVANGHSFAVLITQPRTSGTMDSPCVPGSSRPLRRQLTWGDGGRPKERAVTPNPVFTEPQQLADDNPFLVPSADSEDEFFTSASHPPSSSPPSLPTWPIAATRAEGIITPSLPPVQAGGPTASGSNCIHEGVHVIAHSKSIQRRMDELGICWGVQYELARGETRGWWKWSDVSLEKLEELRGTNASSAWKVFSVMKGVSAVKKGRRVWYVAFLHFVRRTAGSLSPTQGGT